MDAENLIFNRLLAVTSAAASAATYQSWSDKFCREECKMALDKNAGTLTIADIRAIPKDKLWNFGFGNFDGKLVLVPLYLYSMIKDGEELVDIFGDVVMKGRDVMDDDIRYGCLAYGFYYAP